MSSQGEEDRPRQRPRELALSAAWNGGLTRRLQTIDGRSVAVVFTGNWTHGFGPDFSGAMLEFAPGGLQTGSIEIHYRTSEWVQHGHHLDPRYNDVILHVVSKHDMPETRCADGKLVPVAVLTISDDVLFQIDARLPEIWSRLGGSVCADGLATTAPQRLRRAIHHLGDTRLNERVTRFEGELTVSPPNEILLLAIFDAFGYSENRSPMRTLFQLLVQRGGIDAIAMTASNERFAFATSTLFGLGGFLPLAPGDANIASISPEMQAEIERRWLQMNPVWHNDVIAPTHWQRARTRPANHPASRLTSLAALLDASRTDLLSHLTDALRYGNDLPTMLRDLTRRDGGTHLGESRAISIAASVLLPFAIAYARQIDDEPIEEAAISAWDGLPAAESSRPAKRAQAQVSGSIKLRGLGERGQQGLLYLDRNLCTPRRCFECPIAAEVIRSERSRRARSSKWLAPSGDAATASQIPVGNGLVPFRWPAGPYWDKRYIRSERHKAVLKVYAGMRDSDERLVFARAVFISSACQLPTHSGMKNSGSRASGMALRAIGRP